jgi:hypothetical protein
LQSFRHNSRGEEKTATYGYQLYNLKDFVFSERLLGVTSKYASYVYKYADFALYSEQTKPISDLILRDGNIETDPNNPNLACCELKSK